MTRVTPRHWHAACRESGESATVEARMTRIPPTLPRRLRPARAATRNALSSVLRLARVPLRRAAGPG